MKKIIKTISFILVLSKTYSQAVSIEPSSVKFNNVLRMRTPTAFPNNLYIESNNLNPPRLVFAQNGYAFGEISKGPLNNLELISSDGFFFETYNVTNYVSALKINKNGNIGIGTTAPDTKLEINGFTKLGSDAPAIKLKKLTSGCTTSANSGFPSGEIGLTHGITPSKILKVEALVEYATNFWVKDGNDLIGYEFDVYVTNTTISLRNLSGSASSEIRSKPCKILITYEE